MSSFQEKAQPIDSVGSVSSFLSLLRAEVEPCLQKVAPKLPEARGSEPQDHPNRVWYRGQSKCTHETAPGVYREEFINAAEKVNPPPDLALADEGKILTLERLMVRDFQLAAAPQIDAGDLSNLIVLAQHHGLPTRLLDWSTSPLSALYFATDQFEEDGAVIILAYPRRIAFQKGRSDLGLMTIRDPKAMASFRLSGWYTSGHPDVSEHLIKGILPIIPDAVHFRLAEQSSRFTLHVHQAADFESVPWIRIPAEKKADLRSELHRCGINGFSVYGDLDHLCGHLKELWVDRYASKSAKTKQ